ATRSRLSFASPAGSADSYCDTTCRLNAPSFVWACTLWPAQNHEIPRITLVSSLFEAGSERLHIGCSSSSWWEQTKQWEGTRRRFRQFRLRPIAKSSEARIQSGNALCFVE